MRCPYCFQVIDDDARQCAHCGSRLPKELFAGAQKRPAAAVDDPQETAAAALPLSNRQLIAVFGGALLVLACVLGGLLLLARPELLPRSVLAAAPFLATPTTSFPTRQATPATLVTPTSVPTVTACSRRAEMCLTFPGDWLVVDQGVPGWQREADALGETYAWLPTLLNADDVPRVPRLRAISPALVVPGEGRVARLTAGETETVTPTLSLDAIETFVQANPATILELVGPPLQPGANVRRFSREQLAQHEVVVTELVGNVRIADATVPVRARIYLLPANERLYVLSYLADETTMLRRRELFEQILESFVIERR